MMLARLAGAILVAGSGEAMQRGEQATLGPRCQDDVVGVARAAGAPLHPRRDRFTDLRITDDRRVAGAVMPQ